MCAVFYVFPHITVSISCWDPESKLSNANGFCELNKVQSNTKQWYFYWISAKNDWIVSSHDFDCWGKYAYQTTHENELWHVSDHDSWRSAMASGNSMKPTIVNFFVVSLHFLNVYIVSFHLIFLFQNNGKVWHNGNT